MKKIINDRVALVLFCCVMTLCLLGLVFVYSASFYSAKKDFDNEFYFVTKQAIGFAVGVVMLFLCLKVDINMLKKLALPLYALAVVLLLLVFVPNIGVKSYGANRWIGFGALSFQPSELAKFALVLLSAVVLAKDMKRKFTIVLMIGMVLCGLIIIEPNMSITIVVATITFIMMIIGGVKVKTLVLMAVPLLLVLPLLVIIEPYRLARLLAFLDPWATPQAEGYQLIQSFYALGSGGWFGVGVLNSRQKFDFLPFAESDFIFAIVAEETGFVGAAMVLCLFFVVIFCGVTIAKRTQDSFHCYLATGITFVIAVQTFLNIAVVTGMVPPTGVPLPFVSFGGSSLVMFLVGVGLLLNISVTSGTKRRSLPYISNK